MWLNVLKDELGADQRQTYLMSVRIHLSSFGEVVSKCDQIANIRWIIEKAEFQKNIFFCFINYAKASDSVAHNKLWEILRMEYQTTLPASWENCMQVKKQQLEPDMEQWTGSKLGKEYIKAVYCHPAYLT